MPNIHYLILTYTGHLSAVVINTSAFKLSVKQGLKNYRLALTSEHNIESDLLYFAALISDVAWNKLTFLEFELTERGLEKSKAFPGSWY